MSLLVDAAKDLDGIKEDCWWRSEKVWGWTCNYGSVWQFKRCSGRTGLLGKSVGDRDNSAVVYSDLCLFHDELLLVDLILCSLISDKSVHRLIVSSDNLLLWSLLACLIVNDTVSCHVDTHVCRGFVWAVSIDALKHSCKNWIDFYVTVVVDCGLSIRLQMERIDHVHIVEVCCCCLISEIDRVLERYIPDWKCLELCIARLHTALVLMVELRKACCHLAASRSRCSDDDERSCGFDIFVPAVSIVADDLFHIVRIAVYWVMVVNLDSYCL